VKACIALSGPFDWADFFDKLPPLTRDTFRVRSKSKNDDEARKHAATLTLKQAAKSITCPLFVMMGKQDALVPWQEGEKLAAAASGPVVRCFIEDGNHVANNRVYRYRPQSADWMAERLR
jgi:2,6-dihydroxypseudooxynicotine hydrolase